MVRGGDLSKKTEKRKRNENHSPNPADNYWKKMQPNT